MIHLIKLAVGVESVDHMIDSRRRRTAQNPGTSPQFITRSMPRRAAEIVATGGSLYWVIKGIIRLRQRITAIEPVLDRNGRRCCALIFEDTLVATWPTPHRPFQGWRYLTVDRAPPDVGGGTAEPPPEMAVELRALGLL